MITVHHLERSRSHRVIWLMEELGIDYELKTYQRDKKTSLAPKEMMKIHPLGKSPMIDDDGHVFVETGVILEYVIETYGRGALMPALETDAYWRCKYWLHAAEGSYMPPLILELFVGRIESAPMPFFAKPIAKRLGKAIRDAYLTHTTQVHFNYLDTELGRSEWLAGNQFSAADIMMSYPVEAALGRAKGVERFKNLEPYLSRLKARPAYQRAIERGGPVVLG